MNSLLLSDGKICPSSSTRLRFGVVAVLLTVSFSCISCAVTDRSDDSEVTEEVSLKQDAASIQELRKNIPEQKRLRNDELKELLKLMGVIKDAPSRIRNSFNKIQRKRRDKFRKKERKTRNAFSKQEKKSRDKFLKQIKAERKEFKASTSDRDQLKEFYKEIDHKRKEFFANEKDRRKEYESKKRQESKDFYAEQREQRKEFSAELRVYSKKFREMEKLKRERHRSGASRVFYKSGKSAHKQAHSIDPVTKKELKGFQKMDQIPGTHLGADDK